MTITEPIFTKTRDLLDNLLKNSNTELFGNTTKGSAVETWSWSPHEAFFLRRKELLITTFGFLSV